MDAIQIITMIQLDGDFSQLKQKITGIVNEYIKFFPEEYEAFKAGMKEKRDKTIHRTGKIAGTDVIDRPIHEIPETMYGIINLHLTADELEAFQSQTVSRWFAKNFKEFSVVEKV
jgi:hypothetical protein